MAPLAIGQILQWTMSILGAAPQVVELYGKAKEMFTVLFTAGKITVDQQNALHAHIDSIQLMVNAGLVPPSWTLEPDPVDVGTTTTTTVVVPAPPITV